MSLAPPAPPLPAREADTEAQKRRHLLARGLPAHRTVHDHPCVRLLLLAAGPEADATPTLLCSVSSSMTRRPPSHHPELPVLLLRVALVVALPGYVSLPSLHF